MKLYKNYHHFQILHLYEHVLANSILDSMHKLGRWEYLDFYLNAQTFSTGLLLIEFNKYRRFNFNFKSLTLDTSSKNIKRAIQTILNEKSTKTDGLNLAKIRHELQKIHQLPWHNAKDFNLKNVEESANFRLINDRSKTKVIKLTQDFSEVSHSLQLIVRDFITFYTVNFSSFVSKTASVYPFDSQDEDTVIIDLYKTQPEIDFTQLKAVFNKRFLVEPNLQAFFKTIVKPKYPKLDFQQFKFEIGKIKIRFSLSSK